MSSETWLKADQIAHRFFHKLALLVYNARSSTIISHRLDKWFNLETPDTDIFKDHLRIYRTLSALSPPIPPFELQVLLTVPDLATNQVLVLTDPSSARRTHVKPTPSHVLLESWVVIFTPSTSRTPSGSATSTSSISSSEDVAPSSVYKQSITLFRSLFTLLRILPAYKLSKRLKRAGADSSQLCIQVRVHTQSPQARPENILRFGDTISPPSPIPSPSPMPTKTQLPSSNTVNIPQSPPSNTSTTPAISLPTSTYTFPPVSHPLGTLSIAVTYLLSPTFHIDTLESLLSSRFLSQSRDEESFVPTIASRQAQAQSGSIRSTSGGITNMGGPHLSKSPPRSVPPLKPTGTGFGSPSLADRFILPPGGSVPSVRSTSSRPVSLLSSGSAGSGHGEAGAGAGAMLPPSTQAATAGTSAVPIKRPSISLNPLINPFKSPTLSSTSAPHSLHSQYSPHSIHSQYSFHSSGAVGGGVQIGAAAAEQGPTLPSRPPSTLSSQHPFPSQSQVPPSPSLRHPSGSSLSGLGISSSPAAGGTTGSSPASVSSQVAQQPVGSRKYVSSFSHRRQSSTLGSERSLLEKVESNTTVIPASTSSSSSSLVPAVGQTKEGSSSSAGRPVASTSTAAAIAKLPATARSSSPSSAVALQETEEDELSAFVQAIDERVPLGSVRSRLKAGRHPLRDGSLGDGKDVIQKNEPGRQREGSEKTVRQEPSPPKSPLSSSPSTSPLHLNPFSTRLSSPQTSNMPTNKQSPPVTQLSRKASLPASSDSRAVRLPQSRAAIDAELKRMTDEFMTSLSTLNFNTGAGPGSTSVMRRRAASGVSSRGSGSPSPGQSGTSALSGAIGLARRVSLAGGSPSGSIGSSSHSGSGLASGQGSGVGLPLARSPPRAGYKPLYPPAPPPGPSSSSSHSPLNSAGTSPPNLRAPNPNIYQYSSAPSSHPYYAVPSHPHSHSSTQPHQGSPLRSAIPLDEGSSSSPSPIERKGEGNADSGSELGSGYGLGLGVTGDAPTGVRGASSTLPRPGASGGTTGPGQVSSQGGLMRRILTRVNTSEEVIGRLEVDDVGSSGGGGSDNIHSTQRSERSDPEGFSRGQVVYPFPRSHDHSETDKGGKRGNGYRIL